jgi:hypothetical protein
MIEFMVVGGQCLGKDGTQTKGANMALQAKNSDRQCSYMAPIAKLGKLAIKLACWEPAKMGSSGTVARLGYIYSWLQNWL